MRATLVLLLVAATSAAVAQDQAAPGTSSPTASSPISSGPGSLSPIRPAPGATKRQPAQAAAAVSEQTLDQQAKKAREEQERRMRDRDRRLERSMKSICTGC